MIAVFARSNHPHGFGYSHPSYPHPPYGLGAHGYSVIAVKCAGITQVKRVIEHIRDNGLDLPDTDDCRLIYPKGRPEKAYDRVVSSSYTMRWYSGGPADWDFLFCLPGNAVSWPKDVLPGYPADYPYHPSRGDNRFCQLYTAEKVLAS